MCADKQAVEGSLSLQFISSNPITLDPDEKKGDKVTNKWSSNATVEFRIVIQLQCCMQAVLNVDVWDINSPLFLGTGVQWFCNMNVEKEICHCSLKLQCNLFNS